MWTLISHQWLPGAYWGHQDNLNQPQAEWGQ